MERSYPTSPHRRISTPVTRSLPARIRIRLVRAGVNTLFALLARRVVVGLENVPSQGPCLFIFNQVSNFDTPLLFSLLRRTDATGLVAANYRDRPLDRLMIEAGGGTWLRRGASDREALQTALAYLASGWMVGISPEGRRSPTGALIAAQPGAAFLAARARVPILPIAITNTRQLAGALKRGRRITIGVRIGEAFHLPPLPGLAQKRQFQIYTDLMMVRLAALLPVEYHGAYADRVPDEIAWKELGPDAAQKPD